MNLEYASPEDIVPCRVDAVGVVQQGWRSLGTVCADSALAVEQSDSPGWRGSAADAFARRTSPLAPSLRELGELLAEAIGVMDDWTEAVEGAAGDAKAAIDAYREGKAQHRWWLDNHAALEEATGVPLPDPGLDLIAVAERRADQIRDDLDAVAIDVSSRLHAIADAALSRFGFFEDLADTAGAVVAGAAESTWSLLGRLSLLSPLRWVFDFEGTSEQVAEMRNGLEAGTRLFVDDTEAFVEQGLAEAVDVDGLVADPARWAGHLAPDLAAWAAGVGAARRGTRMLDDLVPEMALASVSYPSGSGSIIEHLAEGLDNGRQHWVRLVDTEDDLWLLYLRLSDGGAPLQVGAYDGPMVQLPDGVAVGIRHTSASGGATIDIGWPDKTRLRIHVR